MRTLELDKFGDGIRAIIDGDDPIYGFTPRDIRPVYDIETDTITTLITAAPIAIGNLKINGVIITDKASFEEQIGILFPDAGSSASSTPPPTLNTVGDFATLNNTSISEVTVLDTKRGGLFVKYTGSYAADNGMVFADANGTKWKRKTDVDFINIDWYGTVQVNNQSNDIYSKLMAAIAAASSSEFLTYPTIFIPACPVNYWYYCASKITINTKIRIFGIGSESHIRFFQDTGGFKFNYVTTRGSILKNFMISQYGSSATIGTNFGFEFKDIVYCDNITAKQFGDGFLLYNDSTDQNNPGNSNNSQFYNCHASSNWRHGFYVRGADSNNSIFYSCDAISNGGCGIYDKSFLGNHYVGVHSASNGSPELTWQRGLCTYNGSTYASIKDDNLNNLPTDTNYWYSLGTQWLTGYPSVLAWNSGTTYQTVGPWNLEGANQYGSVISCYMEYDQAPPYISSRCLTIGGAATYRSTVAQLLANNNAFYSMSEIWSGNPGSSGTKRAYVSAALGFVVVIDATHGIVLSYDSTRNVGVLKAQAGADSTASLLITDSNTTAANLGRSVTPSNGTIALGRPIYLTSIASRTAFIGVDLATAVNPSTANMQYGDIYLLTSTNYFHHKPEAVMAKYLEPTVSGTKRLFVVKGYQEDTLSNVSGTYTVGIDYNVATNRGILYNIQFVGSNTTDDCILHREILCVNRSGTVTVVNNTAIRSDYVPGTFSSAAITLTITGSDDVNVTITGLPSGTNGKVHVKRIDY